MAIIINGKRVNPSAQEIEAGGLSALLSSITKGLTQPFATLCDKFLDTPAQGKSALSPAEQDAVVALRQFKSPSFVDYSDQIKDNMSMDLGGATVDRINARTNAYISKKSAAILSGDIVSAREEMTAATKDVLLENANSSDAFCKDRGIIPQQSPLNLVSSRDGERLKLIKQTVSDIGVLYAVRAANSKDPEFADVAAGAEASIVSRLEKRGVSFDTAGDVVLAKQVQPRHFQR